MFNSLFLAFILGFFLLTIKPGYNVPRWLFSVMPYGVIHNMGLAIFAFAGLSVLWGVIVMIKRFSYQTSSKDPKRITFNSIIQVFSEMGTMKRYRNCDSDENSFWKSKHEVLKPWFIHWSIMWGFIGLLVATILDFAFKDPNTEIWLPSRIIGTIAGIFLIYGTSMALYYRIKKITRSYEETTFADFLLLFFLWIAGITGFWLEISVSFTVDNALTQGVFIIHTIISMELVLLFVFSKFAHAFYRPLALLFHFREGKK